MWTKNEGFKVRKVQAAEDGVIERRRYGRGVVSCASLEGDVGEGIGQRVETDVHVTSPVCATRRKRGPMAVSIDARGGFGVREGRDQRKRETNQMTGLADEREIEDQLPSPD